MPTLPKAIRIRTATGWQDVAIVGPPGPQGAAGPMGPTGQPGPTLAYLMPIDPDDTMPDTPVGTIWIDSDASPYVSETIRTIRTGQSYLVAGPLAAAVVVPSFFVPTMGVGQSTKIIGARHKIGSGGGIRVQLSQNGTNIGEEMQVTTTKTTTTFINPAPISDGDEIGVVFAAPAQVPTNLSLSITFEHRI